MASTDRLKASGAAAECSLMKTEKLPTVHATAPRMDHVLSVSVHPSKWGMAKQVCEGPTDPRSQELRP